MSNGSTGWPTRTGSRHVRRFALLGDIDVWLGRGQVSLAEELFRKIDTAGMTPGEVQALGIRATARWLRAGYGRSRGFRLQKRAWRDTLLPYQAASPCRVAVDQTPYAHGRRAAQPTTGRYDEARAAARTADGQET